jgi:chitinase
MAFKLTLSNPSSSPVTVDFDTTDGTASSPSDYRARSGTRTFWPGQVTKTITVLVNGDTNEEPDETFSLWLLDPDGGTLSVTKVKGTILNDDKPTMSVNDVSLAEGNAASTAFTFKVTLNRASVNTVTVVCTTADGTATSPGDYAAATTTLTFAPGVTLRNVTVSVVGETSVEPSETFFVNLSAPTSATIADGQGLGTVLNDD